MAIVEKIVREMAAKHVPLEVIAEKLHLDPRRLAVACAVFEIPVRRVDPVAEEYAAHRRAGRSIGEIAEHFGVPYQIVQYRLKKVGCAPKFRRRPPLKQA